MNAFIGFCLLVSVPMTIALNCYQCSGGSGGCSDPFNKTGWGVSMTGSNNSYTYCKKFVLATVAIRTGDTTCEPSSFVLGTGTVCCQKDLCNKAPVNNQMPIMLIVSFVAVLAKIQ